MSMTIHIIVIIINKEGKLHLHSKLMHTEIQTAQTSTNVLYGII